MFNLDVLLGVLPSLLLILVWTAGLIVVAMHPGRGRWRSLALGGFAALTLHMVVSLLPTVMILSGVGREAYTGQMVFSTGIYLVGLVVEIIGVVLLVGAVLDGRRGLSAPTSAD